MVLFFHPLELCLRLWWLWMGAGRKAAWTEQVNMKLRSLCCDFSLQAIRHVTLLPPDLIFLKVSFRSPSLLSKPTAAATQAYYLSPGTLLSYLISLASQSTPVSEGYVARDHPHCNKQEEELKCIFLSSTLENTESQSRSGAQISAFPHFSTPLLPTQQFSCTLSVLRTIHWLRGKDPTSKVDLQFIAWPHSIKLVHSLIFWPSWTLWKCDRAGCHGSWMFLQVFSGNISLDSQGCSLFWTFEGGNFPPISPGTKLYPHPILSYGCQHVGEGWPIVRGHGTWDKGCVLAVALFDGTDGEGWW